MPNKLYLFADNNEGTAENLGSYRLYNMKIEGDDPRDFQPVLDSNGVPCLMDKVNKKYYYDKNGKGFGCDRYSGVSYIKGDGASWIDTGIIANQIHGYRIETKIINRSVNGEQVILFGSSQNGLDSANVNCHLRYNYYGYPQGFTFVDDGGTLEGWSMKVNEVYSFVITVNQPTSSDSFYLCAGNQRGTALGVCDCGIYYWRVYDTNNNLIQHLIPAIDTDGSIGMYDLVTETFFYNQGTGEFSYGIEEDECPKVNYVEYLEGGKNGEYIETNMNFNSSYKYVLKAQAELTSFWIMGTTGFESNMGYRSAIGINPGTQVVYFGKNKVQFGIGYGDIHYEENAIKEAMQNAYEITLSANGFIINGINYDYTTELNVVSANKMVLFSHVYGSGNQNVKFYYYKVYNENDELIQELLPCLDDNNIPCMYDTISGKYFYNQGEGNFAYGKSIGYTPIKYIETNGTQYIDTGVVVNDNTDIDMVARAIDKLPYIEDGLILCLDAIDNTRDGHNASATVWEDLSGNGLDFNLTDVTVNATNMSFNGTTSVGTLQNFELWRNIVNNTEQYTVEICFKFVGFGHSYQPIISTNLGNVNVAKFIDNIQVGQQKVSLETIDNELMDNLHTISCDGNDIIYHVNTKLRETAQKSDYVTAPNTDVFWIGARLTGSYYRFTGEICSIRIYNKKLTDEERLYNHSSDVVRYGVPTDVSIIDTSKNYLINDFYIDTTYRYKETNTNVEPNLTASAGATLTLGSTYIPCLTESEIEQAVDNGWTIQ